MSKGASVGQARDCQGWGEAKHLHYRVGAAETLPSRDSDYYRHLCVYFGIGLKVGSFSVYLTLFTDHDLYLIFS